MRINLLQVTKANIKLMRKLVINGAENHPGANFVEQRKEGLKKYVFWPKLLLSHFFE